MDTQRTPSERTAEKARPLGKADRAARNEAAKLCGRGVRAGVRVLCERMSAVFGGDGEAPADVSLTRTAFERRASSREASRRREHGFGASRS